MSRTPTPAVLVIPPQVSIRTLREAHGLTIAALAKRINDQGYEAGVTADHLSNCELGRKRPSNSLLHAWARALGISRLDVLVDDPAQERVSA
jgi:transcriptional regulator with XRE-family HTH domain